ncbi:DUF2974 domain-containing protein [Jidongwangia harbinensis]|uniref:DUF2974 domain-containing protein n=1 Tax=Jidongwangia harbinensis TaxID=2878561 RepID=UPI001CDA40A3|nr:DUF2974 domain-containing protein [Jidongwangia harbinensis]MCA2214212.1 DUF2974 domain-containing protein [Jidongwangia harbinensis]
MREVLEIRVHGVSNTPPESMLRERWLGDAPPVRRCAGDEQTGFYRRCADDDRAGLVTEAYSWGQLTSGHRTRKDLQRAGWALLLPFAFVNVALWARPEISRSRRSEAAAFGVRVLAVTLTVTLVLAAAGAGMDQVGWQCRDGCPRTVPGTGFLTEGTFWSAGLRPVAVGMLAPVLVLAGLWVLARRSFVYEAEIPTSAPPRDAGTPLEEPYFWSGEEQVRHLTVVHAAAALASVAGVAALAGLLVDGRPGAAQPGAVAGAFGVAAAAGALAAFALVLVSLLTPGVRDRAATSGGHRWRGAALWCAVGALLAALVFLLVPARPTVPLVPAGGPPEPLPGFGPVGQWLFVGQFVLILLLGALVSARWRTAVIGAAALGGLALAVSGVTTDWSRQTLFRVVAGLALGAAAVAVAGRRARDETHSSPIWGGRSVALFAGAGWATGTLYSAAVLFWVADWLNGGATVTSSVSRVGMSPALLWCATGLVAFGVPVALVAARAAWLLRRRRREARAAPSLSDPRLSPHERRRARDVAAAVATHEFVGRDAVGLLGLLGAAVLGYAAVGVAGSATGLPPQGLLADAWPGTPGIPVVKWLTDAGSVLAGLLLVGLAGLIGLAYRSAEPRRTLGMIWDLATFWPRGAHPFAPPCYGERAVPQLLTRICHTDRSIVLAGHSQGAVLAVAAVLQMPADRRRDVYLLTFGTQLTRLYGRLFPACFGADARVRVKTVLTGDSAAARWRSLYRPTDQLGWAIGTPDGIDVRVDDPDRLAPTGGEVLDPPIRRHSDYPRSAAYGRQLGEAVLQLRTEAAGRDSGPVVPTGGADVTPCRS